MATFVACGLTVGALTGNYVLSFVYLGAIAVCGLVLWLVVKPHYFGCCPDCGVKPGEIHDFGCDVEECPRCRWQLITCECWGDKSDDELFVPASDDEEDAKVPAGLIQTGRIPYGGESRFTAAEQK